MQMRGPSLRHPRGRRSRASSVFNIMWVPRGMSHLIWPRQTPPPVHTHPPPATGLSGPGKGCQAPPHPSWSPSVSSSSLPLSLSFRPPSPSAEPEPAHRWPPFCSSLGQGPLPSPKTFLIPDRGGVPFRTPSSRCSAPPCRPACSLVQACMKLRETGAWACCAQGPPSASGRCLAPWATGPYH